MRPLLPAMPGMPRSPSFASFTGSTSSRSPRKLSHDLKQACHQYMHSRHHNIGSIATKHQSLLYQTLPLHQLLHLQKSNIMSQNESPLTLLQQCVLTAGGPSDMMQCQQYNSNNQESTAEFFINVLKTKASSSISSSPFSSSNSLASAYSDSRSDFNLSSQVWGR